MFSAAVAPYITGVSGRTVVTTEDSTIIFCEGEGYPAPNVTWYHNESAPMEDTRVTIKNTIENDVIVTSEIIISMARMNDSGNYTCSLSSISTYEGVSSTIVVFVQGITYVI